MKATIREDNETQVDLDVATVTHDTLPGFAERVGLQVEQLVGEDPVPTRLVIEIAQDEKGTSHER